VKLLVDTHTHSLLSGHAYSTVFENLTVAAERNLEGLVITEHCGDMPGIHFPAALTFLRHLPEEHYGVKLFRGVESNIVSWEGKIDVPERFFPLLQFVIASLHEVMLPIGNKIQNTEAMLSALNNPYVDILGHPGNPVYDVDKETVVKEAKRLGKMLEFNSHSFEARPGSEPNCREMLRLCKKHEVHICVGSDSHICFTVGDFTEAITVIEEEGFPEELITSRSIETFQAYLNTREARLANIQS
jgi:putative hydrolase